MVYDDLPRESSCQHSLLDRHPKRSGAHAAQIAAMQVEHRRPAAGAAAQVALQQLPYPPREQAECTIPAIGI